MATQFTTLQSAAALGGVVAALTALDAASADGEASSDGVAVTVWDGATSVGGAVGPAWPGVAQPASSTTNPAATRYLTTEPTMRGSLNDEPPTTRTDAGSLCKDVAMPSPERFPVVSFASLGGTITMTPNVEGGITPKLQAADLVASAPGLGNLVAARAFTLASQPSASLGEADILRVVDWARAEVAQGAVGAVIIQGTDTLEETSFLAECVWDLAAPLVFTGAMRGPAQVSADGPANLLAAARVAASPQAQGAGALVVLDDTVHRATRVHKAHSTALSAFQSYSGQVLGRIIEDEVWLAAVPARPAALQVPPDSTIGFVPICSTFLGDDGTVLRQVLAADPAGVVIAGFGAGHVSAQLAEVVSIAAQKCPVVLTTRIGEGGVARRTYGFTGSEIDLQRRGAIVAGSLDAVKSRILLSLLLAGGADAERIVAEFELRGARY